MNPLLDFSGLPRFDAVTPEHVAPAIRELIDENRRLIERFGRSENASDLGRASLQPHGSMPMSACRAPGACSRPSAFA
jgi:hypothetical protein